MHCDQTIVTTMMMMKCVKKILMEVPLPNPHYAADVDADDVDAADADGMEEDDPDGGDHSLLPSPPLPTLGGDCGLHHTHLSFPPPVSSSSPGELNQK